VEAAILLMIPNPDHILYALLPLPV